MVIGGIFALRALAGLVPDGRPAPLEPTSSPCPAAAAHWLPSNGTGATLVAQFSTARHVITVCRDASDVLYYDGQMKGLSPTGEGHISLPAYATADGLVARNGTYEYRISGGEVIVTIDGVEASRSTLTRIA